MTCRGWAQTILHGRSIKVQRAGQVLTLNSTVKLTTVVDRALAVDPNASPLAVSIRNGIMNGTTTP